MNQYEQTYNLEENIYASSHAMKFFFLIFFLLLQVKHTKKRNKN